MVFPRLVVAAGAFAVLAAAQTATLNSASFTMPPAGATSYPIDINSIPLGMKQMWCGAQQNSCNQLCEPRGPSANACDAPSLSYNCTCASGTTPNLVDFNQTIPFFECLYYIGVCTNMTDNAQLQRECQARQCGGSILPISYVSTSTSSSSSSSATLTTTTSDSQTTTATTSPSPTQNSGPIVSAVRNYGLGAFIGGVAMVGFAL